MVTRKAIVNAARSWLGTPYHHQASLRGVGCDCLGLIRGLAGPRPSVHVTFMRARLGSRAIRIMGLGTMWRVVKSVIVAALAAASLTASVRAGEPGCVDWGKAASIIAQNGLLPASAVYQMVQQRTGGKVVSQALCKRGNRYVYKLVVLGPTGEVTNLTVDAATGQS